MIDTTHECPKNGCPARVKRSQLACPAHWRLVSPATQRAVYAAYRAGSVSAHVAAMQDAIDEMNQGETCRRRSERLVADGSHIEWTDATWNPTVGCTKVSPGCDNCYAETFVNRFAGSKGFPLPFDQLLLRGDRFLNLPFTWREPRKVFVNSLRDLFHADVPDEFIAQVFAVMAAAPRHTFQLLTKRHSRMRSLVTRPAFAQRVGELALAYGADLFRDDPVEPGDPRMRQVEWPLPNVWLGVSVEDQHWADIRIPALLETPAVVRWISAEPLIGPVTLTDYLRPWEVATGTASAKPRLDWVVVGGESGHDARPMDRDWARDLRDECKRAGVPFLFKQWGAHDGEGRRVGKTAAGRELDGRTHDGYAAIRTEALA